MKIKKNKDSTLFNFLLKFSQKTSLHYLDYKEIHQSSCSDEHMGLFWNTLIEFFQVKHSGSLVPIKSSKFNSFFPYDWLPSMRLNFAQNLLRYAFIKPDKIALDFYHETGIHYSFTYKEVYESARYWAYRFKNEFNLRPKDVVCAIMPNCPQTVVVMLGASWMGITFSSISCDFGESAIQDRISQIKPKVIVSVKDYTYAGKIINVEEKIKKLTLNDNVDTKIDWVDYKISPLPNVIPLSNELDEFPQFPFDHPLYIMFSSGTTGKPKCIVHGTGGVLLDHIKELGLHIELKESQNIFFYTTCGWMMWNWLISSLYFGSKVVLYEGQPTYPSVFEYLHILNQAKVHIFGTSPKFLKFLEKNLEIEGKNLQEIEIFPDLELILSTGAPLVSEQFSFVKKHFGEKPILGSISGGTDILGCFMMCLKNLDRQEFSVPNGYIEVKTLGMDVDCLSEDFKTLINAPGELVCKKSFPNTPIYFLGDEKSLIYKKSYFSQNENIWFHGDSISINEFGNIIVYGRSDATLNPSGVRIGTSEIYAQVESMEEILDSLAIDKTIDGENYIWLFVKLRENFILDENLISKIKRKIKDQTSARHVPSKIYALKDLPYTLSGKKMELLVSKIFNNKPIENLNAVSNKECLEELNKLKNTL